MSKKQSAKWRERLNARQQRQTKAKSRPRVQTDADVTEDQAIRAASLPCPLGMRT